MSQNISSGLLSLLVDGRALNAMGDFTYSTARTEIEIMTGVDRHASERHTPVTPFIEGTVSDAGDLDTRTLHGARYDAVQLRLLNGKSIKINKATQVSRIEVNAIDGTFSVRFEGTTAADEDVATA
jgi:hypothetical protein